MDRMARAVAWFGLCCGALGLLGPLLANWSALPDRSRIALLACGPLAGAGFAAAGALSGSRTRLGLLVTAVAASVVGSAALSVGYNPFHDPSCSVVCMDLSARVPALTTRGAVVVSAVALVVTASATHLQIPATMVPPRPPALVALVAADLVALAFGGWALWWGNLAWQGIRLWTPIVLAGALATSAAAGAIAGHRRRRRLERLIEALRNDPSSAHLADETLTPHLLTTEQQLALAIARLKADLAERVDQVRASQQRIVTRADSERRRIGADLHDGAQQRLVAAALQLRIAASTAGPEAATSFRSAESAIHDALQRVRHLSHSIYPAYLATEGLEPALREMVADAPGAVRLDLSVGRPVPEAVAVALYTVVEALARPAQPAAGLPVTITLADAGGVLTLESAMPAAMNPRVLVHLRDRVGAVGGTLSIEGGWVKVVIPCG